MLSQLLGRRPLISLLFLLVLSIQTARAEDKPCTLHNNGKFYDLSPLKARTDYEIKTPTGQKLMLNVCQNVKTEMHGIKDDSISEGDVGAFIRRGHGDFVLGKVNTTITIFDSRPRFIISGGSRCGNGDMRASASVDFVCDKSLLGPGVPRLSLQLPPGDDDAGCAYVIEWRSHYACPTSEGGIWNFFAILAIIFLSVLLAYTILGVLYNRYVLQLRGFDQIPQFSIESMRYHGREALDWLKDILASLNIGQQTSSDNYNSLPSAGGRTPNPFSHQSQVSGMGNTDTVEEGAPFSGGGGGFVRPPIGVGKTRSSSFHRPETNPVSHQTQVLHEAQSLSYAAPSPQPSQPAPSKTLKLALETREPTKEELEFMLGEDEEEGGGAQELVDVKPPLPSNSASVTSPRTMPSTGLGSTTSTSPQSNATTAASARGRDLGDEGVIRL